MKKKFEEFNDGIVNVYSVNESDQLVLIQPEATRFGEEKVGVTRHYSAMAAGQRVDKTIHIQLTKAYKPNMTAVIDTDQYNIEKVEDEKEAFPPITRMTLTLIDMHRKKEFA